MFEAEEVYPEPDLIHEVVYNYYGDRMATYTSDQYVKVWDKSKEGKCTLASSLRTHGGSISKVTWAHPKYGQVLATCSFDRITSVWEQIVGNTPGDSEPGKKGKIHWICRTNLDDSKTLVTDVKFGPKLLGLQLATCSTEGTIRIYEALNVVNLTQWTLQHEVQCELPLSCLDWNPSFSKVHSPMIAAGSDDTGAGAGGKVFVYNYSEFNKAWIRLVTINSIQEPVRDIACASNLRSSHISAVATKEVRILDLEPVDNEQSVHNSITIAVPCEEYTGAYPIFQGLLSRDEDEACHYAFYYAVRSGDIQLLDTLCTRWPDNYSAIHLDEILSKVYEELKLKNVLLSEEMDFLVENKLINIRFFSNTFGQDSNVKDNLNNVKERIKLVLQNINVLKSEYLNTEVDKKFLFIAKFIAQNIHILKRQIKSTYDRLPWEEIEFCLVVFVSSHTKRQQINLFYNVALNTSKILNHLENFAKKLEVEKDIINMNDKFADLPKLKREKVVTRIISSCPQFEGLYNDYQQIRDIHSLEKINSYIKLALVADPKERKGQLIITRTLQVTGEYLKNTLESPKLSNTTSELLLLSLPKNTRKIIIDLRNSLSHAYSLSRRTEIEENIDVSFFIGVQNDIKKINDVITDILYNNKIKTIRTLLKKIINSDSLNEIKEVAKILSNVELEKMVSGNFKMMEHETLEKLIKELDDNISDKTNYEKELFDKINNTINCVGTQSENIKMDYITGLASLKSLSIGLNDTTKIDHNFIEEIKFHANQMLKNIALKIDPYRLKDIAEMSIKVFHSIKSSSIQRTNLEKVSRLICEIFFIAEFGTGDLKYIEELRGKLNDRGSFIPIYKQRKTNHFTAEKYKTQLTLKLSELKKILGHNLFNDESIKTFSFYKNDKNLQAIIEMLVLDVLSILSSSNNCLENNLLFLDDNTPLLNGKCLRNHLAHDNALVDILLSDPLMAIILNAKKLVSENLITNKKIGKLVRDDPCKLKDKYDQSLITIINQEGLFTAVENGNLEDLKSYLKRGADIHARSINSWTTLHFAAKGPSLKIIKFIIDLNLSPKVTDTNGQSPLHVAAAHGRKNIVEFFIKEADLYVDDPDNRGKTPLHMAAQNGFKDTVEILLKNKASTVTQDEAGLSPLYYAIRNNHIDVATVLLEKDANVDINEAKGGFTPLHEAAEGGCLEVVNFLLQNKANVNTKNDRNWSPLHGAALNGHLEVLNVLILKGADVNASVINGCTPLHYAVESGHEMVANVLLKYGAYVNAVNKTHNNTPLHYAAQDGHEAIAKILLKNKADANVASVEGITPLHFAVKSGNFGTVTVFLNHGVNIHAKDQNNATPLHYAAESGRREVAELLIKNGAEVNAKDNNGLTPLHIAALRGHTDVVDVLIKNKAGVNARDIYGSTPLHTAAINGSKDIIDLLIKNEAEINIKASDGLTPLHEAAFKGHEDAVFFLIKNKANVNAIANNGLTPLHLAVLGGHKNVVNILIKNKSSVDAKGIADVTPLHAAVKAGHKEIVEVLAANGADVNVKSNNLTPLGSAIICNNKEIVEVLVANGADVNAEDGQPLLLAVLGGYRDTVDILLKNKACVNLKDPNYNTPLHVAAKRGHKEIVNALITRGGEVDATNINWVTPLYHAAAEGHEEVVEILIANQADVNVLNDEGAPIHIAAGNSHDDVVRVLLNNGAKINLKDTKNRTALQLAVARGHLKVVKILLQYKKVDLGAEGYDYLTILHIASQGTNQGSNLEMVKNLVNEGCNINARNASGSKSIHIAAREGYTDTVKFFLSKGLSINEPGLKNQTLLHYAAINGHLEVMKFLITEGADVNAKDANGLTPVHIAAYCGCKDVIKVLVKNGAVYNAVDKLYRTPLKIAINKNVINLLTSTEKLFKAVKHNSASDVKINIKAGAFVNAKNADIVTPLHYAAWKGYEEVVSALLQNKADPNIVGKKRLTPLHYAAKFSHLKVVNNLLSNGAVYNALSEAGETPSDLTEDKSIRRLFNLVSNSFTSIKNDNLQIVNDLNKIKDIDTVKAIMNAHDRENKTLVVAAMHSKFSKIEELKAISQGDVFTQINIASVSVRQGDYQKALNIFKSAFEKRKEILGPDNPGTRDPGTNSHSDI